MSVVQFERSNENTRKFCHCEDDEFCQLNLKAFISQSNWKLLPEIKDFLRFKMNGAIDFTKKPVNWGLKVGEPGYF